jgi:hypothetical protein
MVFNISDTLLVLWCLLHVYLAARRCTSKRNPIHFYYNMHGHILESVQHAKYLGQAVSKAVITVPAYFSDAQRQATREGLV